MSCKSLSHILVFDYEKGKATFVKIFDAQKAKGYLIKLEYQKFQASISQWDVLIQKDQMIWCIWNQMKSFKVM